MWRGYEVTRSLRAAGHSVRLSVRSATLPRDLKVPSVHSCLGTTEPPSIRRLPYERRVAWTRSPPAQLTRHLCASPQRGAAHRETAGSPAPLKHTVEAEESASFYAHLRSLAWPERKGIGAGLLLLSGSSAVSLVFPKVMGDVMDVCLSGSNSLSPYTAAIGLLGLFGVQAILVAARARILVAVGERVASSLRERAFASLLRQDMGFFDQTETGELLSRLSSDTSSLQKLLTSDLIGAARGVVMVSGGLGMMVSISPSLCVVAALTFPAAVGMMRWAGDAMRKRQAATQKALASASSEAHRALLNIRTLRLFAGEPAVLTRYSKAVRKVEQEAIAVGGINGLAEAGIGLAMQASLLTVLAVGGQQVIDGALSYGELSSFLMYTVFLGFNAGGLGGAYAEVRRAAGASERLLEVMHRTPQTAVGDKTLDHCTGRIEMRDVHFAFPSRGDVPVLSGLNLTIAPGERVALLGPSGSGKSTIAALLCALYTPQQGQVLIDGVDVTTIKGSHLRGQLVDVVPQEPVLLSGSLSENIKIGKPEASDEEVRVAATSAGCDFAEHNWEREVGEQGLQLSGGQKQRVALARVLLRNSPIVVLDEFTSALDKATEEALLPVVDRVLKGRTVLIITHRRAALGLVDRVVELGPSGSLIRDSSIDSFTQSSNTLISSPN